MSRDADSPGDPNLRLAYGTDLGPAVTVFYFDGSEALQQTFDATSLAFPTEELTLSLWLNTSQADGVVLTYGPTGGGAGPRLTVSTPSNLQVSLGASTTGQTNVSLNDERWHQLTVTLSRSSRTGYRVRVYKDGRLAYQGLGALTQDAAGGLSPAGQLVLGSGAGGAGDYLVAYASNFQLWGEERGGLDIRTDMQRRLASATPGLILNWLLDGTNTEGPNSVDSFRPSPQTSAPLRYRAPQNVAGYVVAEWTPEAASSYTFQMVSADGQWRVQTAPAVSPLTVEGVLAGRAYQARLGIVSGGLVNWLAPVGLVPLDLWPPAPEMSWSQAGALTAAWQALDQAQAYQVALYEGGSATPSSVGTQTALSSTLLDGKLDSRSTWLLKARALSEGSLGPANETGSLDRPELVLVYAKDYDDEANSAFRIRWGAAAPPFLYAAVETGGSPPPNSHWPGSAAQPYVIPYPVALPAGTQVTGHLRAVTTAALGEWDDQTITVLDIAGPILNPLQISQAQKKVTATWDFANQGEPVPYEAQLYADPDSPADDEFTADDVKTATLDFGQAAEGTVLQVRVRAQFRGNMSRWSQSASFRVGSGLMAPTVQSVCVDTGLNVSAAWSGVAGAEAYDLLLTNPTDSTFRQSKTGVQGTAYNWVRAETGVQSQTTYELTITATAQGQQPGPPSRPRSFNTGQLCPGASRPVVADPVNQATGQYVYAHVEMEVGGVVPLEFITYYASPLPGDAAAPATPLGPRWNHSFNTRIVKSADNATASVLWGDGRSDSYQVPSSVTGQYPKFGAPNGDRLLVEDDLSYRLTLRDQTVYRFSPGGALLTMTARDGNVVNLSYAAGLLERVTDAASGRFVQFHYNAAGQIESLNDNAGRRVSFAYFPDTLDLRRVTYDLVGGANPDSPHRDFTYEAGSLLKTVTDENNVKFLTNEYDDRRRVSRQLDADDRAYTFAYETLTDANGFGFLKLTLTSPEGYTHAYLSNSATSGLVAESHALGTDAGSLMQVISRAFDGFNNLLAETVYEGPPLTLPLAAPLPGNTTAYAYDGNGNVRNVTDPLGNLRCFHYDDRNNLTQYTDLLRNVTRLDYDGNLLKAVTSPLGHKKVLDYRDYGPALNRLHTVTEYPGNGGAQGAVGNVVTFDYDDRGQMTLITDPYANTFTLGYDAANRGWLTSAEIKDRAGTPLRKTRLVFDDVTGRVTDEFVQLGQQTEAQAFHNAYHYDGTGNVKSVTDPLTHETKFDYNAADLLWKITYPAKPGQTGDQTVYAYDGDNRLSEVTYSQASPHVSEGYAFDPLGRLRKLVDGNLKDTLFDYSMPRAPQAQPPYPLLETVTFPKLDTESEPYQTQATFDALGRLTRLTDITTVSGQTAAPATAVAYSVEADPDNPGTNQYRVETTLPKIEPGDPQSLKITAVYDALGRLKRRTDERGKDWLIAYAASVVSSSVPPTVNQVAALRDPLGNETVLTSDALGRLTGKAVRQSGAAADLEQAAYELDVLDRLTKVTEQRAGGQGPLTTTYEYGYDEASRCAEVRVKPYGGAASVYRYDGGGRWVRYADALGLAVDLQYTPRGQLESYGDNPRQTLRYAYDAAGRFTTLKLPGGTADDVITQVLDGNGNRLQTKRGAAVVITREFDALDRLTSRQRNQYVEAVGYTYWPGGQLHQLTYPGLSTPVVYEYDGLQRLKKATDWQLRATSYTYYPTGQLNETRMPGGVVRQQTIDDAGRLTGFSITAGDLLLARADYAPLDAAGRPTRVAQVMPLAPELPPGTRAMTYSSDRLDSMDGQAIGYDGGNMTAVPGVNGALSYDALNQLIGVGATTRYGYDEDGLRETITRDGRVTRYVRDAARYVAPLVNQGDPASAVLFAAPARLPEGVSLLLPWVGEGDDFETEADALDRALVELDEQGNVSARYVYGHGLISREGPGGSADDYQLFISDALGATLALFSPSQPDPASGHLTDRYAYGPYGDLAARYGATPNPFLFHGGYGVMDDGQGLLFMRARYYCPRALRFVSKDFLFGDGHAPQTLNRYTFVAGNPLQSIDPLGLSTLDTAQVVGLVAALLPVLGGLGAALYYYFGGGAGAAGAAGAGGAGAGGGGLGSSTLPRTNFGGRGGPSRPPGSNLRRRTTPSNYIQMQTFRSNVSSGSAVTQTSSTGSPFQSSSGVRTSGGDTPGMFSRQDSFGKSLLRRSPKLHLD